MRQVLSMSLPLQTAQVIKKLAKKRGFDSVSAYIKYLVREDEDDLISADELLKIVEEGDREYERGETIKADSIADLL